MTASEMFGVPIEGMPAETRRRAKAINFGIVYGISAFGLANQLSIPQDEAGAYIKTYFERFPGIRAYMDRDQAACVRDAGLRHHHLRPQGPHPRRPAASRRPSGRSPTARRSTPRSRARPPTSCGGP